MYEIESERSGEYHVTELNVYLKVFFTLLGLTGLTIVLAQFNFGAFNAIIALTISTIKGWLVIGYFMGLRHEEKLNKITILSSLIFVAIFYVLIAMDVFTRETFSNYNSVQKPAPNTQVDEAGKTITTPKQ